jgi:hypothetical protein
VNEGVPELESERDRAARDEALEQLRQKSLAIEYSVITGLPKHTDEVPILPPDVWGIKRPVQYCRDVCADTAMRCMRPRE